ncbi:MAG: DUF3047 domain-containing protein [Limisphaerales bacterium]
MKFGLNTVLGLFLVCAKINAATLFSEDFEKGLTKRWEPVKFQGLTEYLIVKEDENSVLQARADKSATGLGAKAEFEIRPNTKFTWRWKLDKNPPGATDDAKKTFDHTVRIFVAFKTTFGPPRTVNYVWSANTPVGKTFNHPSSGRARFIVLESGDGKAGQWMQESRDLYADWKLLFNEEPPNVVSVGLMTDSDGTASTVTGWYDDLLIESASK